MDRLIIATRASKLALWQAYYIKDLIEKNFPIKVELKEIVSRGDKVLDRPLALIGGKGHFTKELEDYMLNGKAHMAVHSLKDVPTFIPKGLKLAAVTKREDQSDLFLSQKYRTLEDLPPGAVVGTTSLRRRMQLLLKRDDLILKDLRGNVNTRLKKLKDGEYDAIVLAYIGLKRLNLLDDIKYTQKLDLIPPMGQASLGIEIVEGIRELEEIANFLNDKESALLTKIERDFIAKIGAGCSAPVAVNAKRIDNSIEVEALLGFSDASKVLYKKLSSSINEADSLGEKLAELMIKEGALELLREAEERAFKDFRVQRL